MKKVYMGAVGTIVLIASVLFGGVAPASAATKTVSITIGDWNCRQDGEYKGSISKVLIDAVPSTSPEASWINGKTRSGVSVTYNPSGSAVTVAAVIFCKTNIFGAGYYRELSFGKWVDSNTSTSWEF